MGIVLINHGKATASGSVATTGNIDMTGANFLACIAVGEFDGTNTQAVTSSPSNTWLNTSLITDGGDNVMGQIFYSENPTVSATMTFTNTVGASRLRSGIYVFGYSGVCPGGTLDGHTSIHSSGTTVAPGSITPKFSGEVFVGGAFSVLTTVVTAVSVDTSFTIEDSLLASGTSFRGGSADLVLTGKAATSPTFTLTTNGANGNFAVLASFRPFIPGWQSPTAGPSFAI